MYLAEQEGDFDADSRWALTWFDQMGFAEGDFGVAEQLSKSKNTSVPGLAEAGILVAEGWQGASAQTRRATHRLGPDHRPAPDRLGDGPPTDPRPRIRRRERGGGPGRPARRPGRDRPRTLLSRLYTLCERRKRATEAMAYNGLVQSWPEITRLAQATPPAAATGTGDLFA
jgi:putative DNA methylase